LLGSIPKPLRHSKRPSVPKSVRRSGRRRLLLPKLRLLKSWPPPKKHTPNTSKSLRMNWQGWTPSTPRPLRTKKRPSKRPPTLKLALMLLLRPLVNAERKNNKLPTRDNSLQGKPTSKVNTQPPGQRPPPASP